MNIEHHFIVEPIIMIFLPLFGDAGAGSDK